MTDQARKSILLISHDGWPSACRFPKAAHDAGFDVLACGFRNDPIFLSRYVKTQLILPDKIMSKAHALSSIAEACLKSEADFIVPCDEVAVLLVNDIYADIKEAQDDARQKLTALILKSRGNPEFYNQLPFKFETVEVAASIGINTPPQKKCDIAAEAKHFASGTGYPIVLKGSFGNAGVMVRVCKSENEIEQEFKSLKDYGEVSIQTFIDGIAHMINVVALDGKILANAVFEKVECYPDAKGPSSVVRHIEHKKITKAAEEFVAHVGYSGILSLDFMVDKKGKAYLIECNPRPTPVSHLGEVIGIDVFAALCAGLSKQIYRSKPQKDKLIALFPKEIMRDDKSAYLFEAHHDAPWDQPEIFDFYMMALRKRS